MKKTGCPTTGSYPVGNVHVDHSAVAGAKMRGRATLQFSHRPSWHDAELLSTQTLPEGMVWTQTSRANLSYYSSVTEVVRKI